MTTYNPVGWFEIYVSDMTRATQFYETVFTKTLYALPMPNTEDEMEMMVFDMLPEAKGASGALVKMNDVQPGGSTLVYFTSEDCAIEESRIEAAGGKVYKPKQSIGEYGFITLAIDTEGNMFGIHSQQ
jgi:uncharacterized protein